MENKNAEREERIDSNKVPKIKFANSLLTKLSLSHLFSMT